MTLTLILTLLLGLLIGLVAGVVVSLYIGLRVYRYGEAQEADARNDAAMIAAAAEELAAAMIDQEAITRKAANN